MTRQLFRVIALLLCIGQPLQAWAQDAPPAEETPAAPAEEAAAAPAETAKAPPAPLPTTIINDPRIVRLEYNSADVYIITTRYGYQTNINFGKGEEIETISIGDKTLWQIIPSGSRIFIRPMEEDVMTNMTVLTNKRTYQFDLKSLGPAETEGNLYVVGFIYPDEAAPAATPSVASATAQADAAQFALLSGNADAASLAKQGIVIPPGATLLPPEGQPAVATASGTSAIMPAADATPLPASVSPSSALPAPASSSGALPAPASSLDALPANVPFGGPTPPPEGSPAKSPAPVVMNMPAVPEAKAAAVPVSGAANFNYTYSGSDVLAPLQVFDDGRSTYLKYANLAGPLPDAYVLDRQGQVVSARRSVSGEYLVVDAVAPEMILKNGQASVHVFNEAMVTP